MFSSFFSSSGPLNNKSFLNQTSQRISNKHDLLLGKSSLSSIFDSEKAIFDSEKGILFNKLTPQTSSKDESITSNYNKLYISFFLNKQKYNIKILLSFFKNTYEIRKRIFFINQALLLFENAYKNKDKTNFFNNTILEQTTNKSSYFFKKRLKRNYCLKKNSKSSFLNSSPSSLTGQSSKKQISLLQIKHFSTKIAKSIEKTYWIKYKLNINWFKHNKNIYYIKTISSSPSRDSLFLNKCSGNVSLPLNTHSQKQFDLSIFKKDKIFSILGNINFLLNKVIDKSTNLTNNNNSQYYLHILLNKLLVINSWKSLLSLRDIKKHKHYNFFILNHVLKPLIFQIYTRFDRFHLLNTLFFQQEKKYSSIIFLVQYIYNNRLLKSFLPKFFNVKGQNLNCLIYSAKLNNNKYLTESSNLLIDNPDKKYTNNLVNLFKEDIFCAFFKKHIENLNIIKNISHVLDLRTDYNLFFVESSSKKKEKNISNSSYFFKPLVFGNKKKINSLFDQNFERNSFYISKIKDLKNPLLFPSLQTQYFVKNMNNVNNDLINKWISLNKKNLESYQKESPKNLTSIQIDTGPKILIKKSNNKLNIEWHINSSVSPEKGDIHLYKKLVKKYSIGFLVDQNYARTRAKQKTSNNNSLQFFENLKTNNLYKKDSEKEKILNIKNNFDFKKIKSERDSSFWTLFCLVFSFKLKSKNINNYQDKFNEIVSKNDKVINNFLCFQKNYLSPIITLLPSIKGNNKYHSEIKSSNFIHLDGKITKILQNQINKEKIELINTKNKSCVFDLGQINLSSFLLAPDENNSILISNPKNKYLNKFLPLPKTPINDSKYQYLRKYPFKLDTSSFSHGVNDTKDININIKHYYSKTHDAYTLITNLSRFLIAFIKKNKGGKNKFQQLKNISYRALQSQICNNYKGIGFRFSGRVYGAKKAMSFKMLFGSVPFNTLKANIDYAYLMQKTRNGTWGFQTWLNLKPKKSRQIFPQDRRIDFQKNNKLTKKFISKTTKNKFLTPFSVL